MFKKELDAAMAGDNAGILLRGVKRDDVKRGMVLAKAASSIRHGVHPVAVISTRMD